ncbi:HupE/UreJ family protein [Bradyrhizobium sp. STM 3557]|uniref:HupE/UreJ family protein n=1 Tax=Bradyrhizobium sp. STM 3557 TaxID=578920 RepID=UPI00388FEB8E
MTKRALRVAIAPLLLLLHAAPAQAHIVSIRLGDFYAGALHPLTDLQDLILWTALGVLAGSLGAAIGRWLVLIFPLGLLAGMTAVHWLGTATIGPVLNASLILVLGLLLAAAPRIPLAGLCMIAFSVALLRGAVNAADLAPQSDRLLFAAGLACVGYVMITLVMALAVAFMQPDSMTGWRSIAIRSLGGWVAAIGLMMLGLSFAT